MEMNSWLIQLKLKVHARNKELNIRSSSIYSLLWLFFCLGSILLIELMATSKKLSDTGSRLDLKLHRSTLLQLSRQGLLLLCNLILWDQLDSERTITSPATSITWILTVSVIALWSMLSLWWNDTVVWNTGHIYTWCYVAGATRYGNIASMGIYT